MQGADAEPWDAGALEPVELAPGSPVALAPRAADGTLSGTYTATMGLGTVELRVRATGPTSAEATYRADELSLTVRITDATHGTVIVGDEEDLPLDGYGELTVYEQAYMFGLLIPPLGWAARDVALELGCSRGVLPSELQALILPWQLALKYANTDRAIEIRTAASLASCNYFSDPFVDDPRPRPSGEWLHLGWSDPIPSVFGFFPFDAVGAFEVPEEKSLPGGLACVLPNSYDDSARGLCGAMCGGACGGWCSPAQCTKTEIFPPDCCSTPAGNAIPYSSKRAIYECQIDSDCELLDTCYETCNLSKGCGSWASFQCRHDVGDPNACDRKICDAHGTLKCLGWLTGLGPKSSTKTYRYHSEPEYDPACGPSGCFPAGTLVSLASGERVPIEAVRPGDHVLAAELADPRAEHARVEEVLVHRDGPYVLDRLVADAGDELELTPEHPVWTVDRGFVPASELEPGDLLLHLDADTGVPETVRLVAVVRAVSEAAVVYNLKTTRGHYVAQDLVVHNKCVAAGTLVDGPGGARPIEALHPGDLVYGTGAGGERVATRVTRVFEKRTVLAALPGKRLAPGVLVTANHAVPTALGDVPAGALVAEDAAIAGAVWDLATESGDYLVRGVRLRAAE